MVRIVGDHAHGPAFDADEGGDDADAELLADLQHRARVGDGVDDVLHVVEAQAVLGDDVAQAALVGRLPVLDRALEVGQVLLGHFHGVLLVLGEQVDDAVRHLEGHRAHLFGRVDAEAPALDHGGTAHGDGGALGGDDDVAAGDQGGVAGEGAPVDDRDQRHEARELRELREGVGVEGDARSAAVVAGASAAAFPEEDQRNAETVRQLEHAILLVVVAAPLGSREHGVVVVHEHRARGFFAEERGVDRADAGDQAVRRGVPAQRLHVVAAVLAGDDQRPVFLERTLVHELGDVLPRHAVAARIALGDGLGAVLVVDVGVAFVGLLEVRADVVEVLFLGHGHRVDADLGFFDEDDRVALAHHVAFGKSDLADDAVAVRGDDVLHLHGLHDGDLLAFADLVAGGDVEGHDRALDR